MSDCIQLLLETFSNTNLILPFEGDYLVPNNYVEFTGVMLYRHSL